ncbi:DUF1223 domain-containing protein [Niastella populi]|uniref:DUF1223 domain-containing protein n=1 Tax=Niastella populi TaxID=550983 RepID=A0A1V9F5G3_9BACT|nr:DUF1223 domain-containing protein [Niastella populi]OQP53531.1 hypothetical protein A4R26_06005 [Niastella populi]
MKTIIVMITIAVLAAAFARPLYNKDKSKKATAGNNNGFVVAELFTSEGCSSCPPADKLIQKITQENTGKSVYVLAFHVDYWDHQGWKDRFSDAAHTERQRRYAGWLNLETVYTPQMVINGHKEFIGSYENNITKAITKELAQPAAQTISLRPHVEGNKLHVDFTAAAQKNAELVLALVQKTATSNVKAGENTGRHLTHVQIVRQLYTQDVSDNKKIMLDLPGDFNANAFELIGFVQQKKNGRITAAAKAEW